jgi:NAD(P)-dependent dehydrogenase (short-subunit alcohol dehydrogenase family)
MEWRKEMSREVVIVTGAGNGIGRAVAKEYAKNGAIVIATDIDIEAVKDLVNEEGTTKERAEFIHALACDVREESQIKEMVSHVKQQFDRIDILINNAGVSTFKSPFELSVDEWDDVINTNLRSVFICTKEVATIMKQEGYGSIVNIASTRAFMSEPNSEAYAASKGGIVSLTHAYAASLQDEGIRVNAISPGWIHTGNMDELRRVDHEQHFSNRVGAPKDIALACLYLTNRENSFITGENIILDGGMTRKMMYEH